MSCSDFEPIIFLLEEADQGERTALEHHLKECAHCRALFSARLRDAQTISNYNVVPEPDFPGALTNRIMAAIQEQQERSLTARLFSLLHRPMLKYGMAAASLLLTIFFSVEITGGADPVAKQRAPIQAGVKLNTMDLITGLRKEPKTVSLYAAVRRLDDKTDTQ